MQSIFGFAHHTVAATSTTTAQMAASASQSQHLLSPGSQPLSLDSSDVARGRDAVSASASASASALASALASASAPADWPTNSMPAAATAAHAEPAPSPDSSTGSLNRTTDFPGPAQLPILALLQHTSLQPDKMLYTFLNDQGAEADSYTYARFERVTAELALRLRAHAKTNVLLVYPPGLDFIVAFVACLRARVVAVPVYPPRPGTRDLDMFLAVQKSCGAKVVLTNSRYNWAKRVQDIKSFLTRSDSPGFPTDLEWLVTDTSHAGLAPSVARIGVDDADEASVAFLQYTSGSTSLPKGVVLTHGNLAHNLSLIVHALKAGTECRVVSWLPQYHDMGLIGSHLGSMYCGGQAWLLSPVSFVKSPPLWLASASHYRATHLQAPNFAYKLTVRKYKALAAPPALDLRSVVHIFDAAEPVDPDAIDLFLATFAPSGLRREALVPGYGLAEHTVYVCDGGRQRLTLDRLALESENKVVLKDAQAPDSRVLVGCGFPPPSVTLRIVEPSTCTALAAGSVGEIWLASKSKAQAYFGLPEKTEADLHARLAVPGEGASGGGAGDEAGLEFLRTGDMGFLHRGELFVCGRIKDMMIVRGRNLFPQDLERSVERTKGIRAGCSAAFTLLEQGQDVICVVAEVREDVPASSLADLAGLVRANVAHEHGTGLHAVVLIKPHSIPKTTSGKVSRYRAKDAFVAGALDALEAWRAASPEDEEEPLLPSGTARYEDMTFEQVLARFQDEAAALLEVEHVDPDMPLWEMGFDSMMLTQLKGGLRNSLGCEVEDDKLFHENATLRVLVQDLLGATPPAVDKSNVAGADPAEAATAQPCPRGPASILRACCQPCRPTAAS